MRIIFVRHGHPDYEKDCLTELGHLQAEAVAKRLSDEKIHQFFSSACGRAAETAEHIAILHNKKVQLCDFMQEIGWGHIDDEPMPHNGHPWTLAEEMVKNKQNVMSENWANEEPFCKNKFTFNAKRVGEEFDRWLEKLGYEREGRYYRVTKSNDENVVMVSHGGSSSAVLSHIFNLPLPFVCFAICPDFTAITVVKFGNEKGTLTSPRFEIMNDRRHIEGITAENIYGI